MSEVLHCVTNQIIMQMYDVKIIIATAISVVQPIVMMAVMYTS